MERKVVVVRSKLERILHRLDGRGQQHPLMPEAIWSREVDALIRELDWCGHEGETAVIAVMAGLHLCNDHLDVSHSFAQLIEQDATGAYWHGIMHRMEGDFSNGKYWFYQAGKHPAMQASAERIALALRDDLNPEAAPPGRIRQHMLDFRDQSAWSPSVFTDVVQWQQGRALDPEFRSMLERIQAIEARVLLSETLRMCSSIIDSLTEDARR